MADKKDNSLENNEELAKDPGKVVSFEPQSPIEKLSKDQDADIFFAIWVNYS